MHPYITVFGYPLASYGLMYALGVIAALIFSMISVRKARLRMDLAFILFTMSLFFGIIGSFLLHTFIVYTPSELISLIRSNAFPESFNVGFVYYGGFLSGILGAYLTSKLLRFPLLAYARRMLPALSLAHAFGRIGCFLAGCCYGVESKLLGVCYPESNLLTNAPKGVPLFPVQLLEAFLLLLIAFMLYRLMQKTSLHPLKAYILLYAPVRFLLEFLRYDSVRGAFLFLSTSQWISLILILLALMPVKSIHRH